LSIFTLLFTGLLLDKISGWRLALVKCSKGPFSWKGMIVQKPGSKSPAFVVASYKERKIISHFVVIDFVGLPTFKRLATLLLISYNFVATGCHPLDASKMSFISRGCDGCTDAFLGSSFTIG
jgi:hypothetical protein